MAAMTQTLATLEDSALIGLYMEGHERAFAEIDRRYAKRICAFVHRIVGDWHRAEDITQEAFLRVVRHIERYDQTRKFSTWLFTIAGNLAKNELRNRARSPLVLHQTLEGKRDPDHRPMEWEDPGNRPDDLYHRRFLREKIEEAVASLPEHHQEVFVLREFEVRSYQEIAQITGCNLGTVKSRLSRARNRFASSVGPKLE